MFLTHSLCHLRHYSASMVHSGRWEQLATQHALSPCAPRHPAETLQGRDNPGPFQQVMPARTPAVATLSTLSEHERAHTPKHHSSDRRLPSLSRHDRAPSRHALGASSLLSEEHKLAAACAAADAADRHNPARSPQHAHCCTVHAVPEEPWTHKPWFCRERCMQAHSHRRGSDAERLAAPAAVCSVGVIELEATANKGVTAQHSTTTSNRGSRSRAAVSRRYCMSERARQVACRIRMAPAHNCHAGCRSS